jgi:hypothetical protein
MNQSTCTKSANDRPSYRQRQKELRGAGARIFQQSFDSFFRVAVDLNPQGRWSTCKKLYLEVARKHLASLEPRS